MVQDVVDDHQQVFGRLLDGLGVFALFRVHFGVEHELAHAHDGVHRGADLVAHIGQELRLVVGRLLGHFLLLLEVAAMLPVAVHGIAESEGDQRHEAVKPAGPPVRGRQVDGHLQRFFRPNSFRIGGLDTKGVVAGIEIGIGGLALVAHILPVAVETDELIGVAVAGGANELQAGKFQGKDVVAMRQTHLAHKLRRNAQVVGFVQYLDARQHYPRRRRVGRDLLRVKSVNTVDPAEVDPAFVVEVRRGGVELLHVVFDRKMKEGLALRIEAADIVEAR